MEKKVKKEKDDIVENFNITSTGSLLTDITKIDIRLNQLPDIEVREVIIKETGNFLNLKDNVINIPVEMIVFPFFTPQKQNKRVNFQYSFEDLGVTMYCTLVAKDSRDKVFQPSIFEEKIYTYLISTYEAKKDLDNEDEYIEFEISDFIVHFLGNKMNRTYYTKVEQALKNLKNTEYQFIVSNHTKLGKYKFEDEEFKLLTYQKLKKGKKIYYRVTLNKNIRKKISDKRYIKYNSKALMEILAKDPIAGRIYKYISKIRYEKQEDRINLRTIAAIIPLKTEQTTERVNKNGDTKTYVLCRMKQVLKRVEKAYDVLVELGYVEYYKSYQDKSEDTYYIIYKFNSKKDGECHVSSFIENSKSNKTKEISYSKEKEKYVEKSNFNSDDIEEAEIVEIIDEKPKKEEKLKIENKKEIKKEVVKKIEKNNEFIYPDEIIKNIQKAKKNIYVSRSWDKRTDTKIKKIFIEEGEIVLIEVLKIIYKNLNSNIKTTLVQYINGVLKNLLSQESDVSKQNLTLFNNIVKEKGLISKKKINQARRTVKKPVINSLKELIDETDISVDILKVFDEYDEYEKLKIEEQAIKLCSLEENIDVNFLLTMKRKSKKIYFNTIKKYIERVINE
ncbi:MAG: replication initiator protein A [Cetobacterium sp.]|uniref:replication initiator protein A n=2 Tax=Fusobacteriaceae TaxID=203492 RepID=UPI001F057631|nr:replication initiator protein A [Cetobacterium somerae]MCX3068264.1 replication initiator protein A [Cetobacterium somerae]UPO97251.1 replication initiator protein A [Cetobacterium somerae]